MEDRSKATDTTTEHIEEAEKNNTATEKRTRLKKELEEARRENRALKEQMLRLAAEFDNFKKRVDRERMAIIDSANVDLVKSLLPVIDDLERSLEVSEKKVDYKTFVSGIDLILRNLVKILKDQGLRVMETVDHPFDPEKHDALLQVEAEGKDANIVIDEHVKGYEFKDRVLRHAKVIVSK
jgi:molecular chaperone GrpE